MKLTVVAKVFGVNRHRLTCATGAVLACAVLVLLGCSASPRKKPHLISVESRSVPVGAKSIGVKFVRLSLADYEPEIAWPAKGLGTTAELASIAKGAGAAVAINGCFFDAYRESDRKNPNQNLFSGGRVIHMGGTGCTLGFDAKGRACIDRVRVQYRGNVVGSNGRSKTWYAYRANHTPTSGTIAGYFDRAYGRELSLGGVKVVVEGGRVTNITNYPVAIPASGYVLLFSGGEAGQARRFSLGATVGLSLHVQGGDAAFWRRAVAGVGGGPKLLTNGEVDLRFDEEGFNDPKIRTGSFPRSMAGVDGQGRVVLAVSSGTVREMASVMRALGCVEAMNLDGGASSGLWLAGKGYVRPAGRPLTNLLVFRPRR
jgi:hypothetical protein